QFALSPEELLISEEDQKQIITIIESLDSNYQEIIRLRFFEEKSIKEIAEELSLTVANTKVRIMRAKKVLAELLKNKEFED
ncbi:MAG TPA: RNA polymerase subunit sigma-24, partial [Chryseobacterium sp.]|nr:RNA polymerase subunit sigma-24 [Chryseobacterium sp.]